MRIPETLGALATLQHRRSGVRGRAAPLGDDPGLPPHAVGLALPLLPVPRC